MVTLKATASVNQRKGAGTDADRIQVIPKDAIVKWYGYSFCGGTVEWKLVEYQSRLGFVSGKYLREV